MSKEGENQKKIQTEGALPEEEPLQAPTPDIAAPASEYKLRDMLRTPSIKRASTDAVEQTVRDIAKELNQGLIDGTLIPKMLSIFKGLHPDDADK